MSRNQQIIILVVAILISIGLVVGAYMKKKGGSLQQGGTPVASGQLTTGKPKVEIPPPVEKKKFIPKPVELPPANNIYRKNPVIVESAAVREVTGQMRLLSVSITAAIMRRKLEYGQLEYLDFSPQDAPGGSDYAVFNPKGLLMFRGMLNSWIRQETIDELTTKPGQTIWYSLRRSESPEAVVDVLYAVIPFPSANLCGSTRYHFSLANDLKFADDNGTVVTDRAGQIPKDAWKFPSCIFTPDKRVYWFYPLRSRLMRPGSKTWQAAP